MKVIPSGLLDEIDGILLIKDKFPSLLNSANLFIVEIVWTIFCERRDLNDFYLWYNLCDFVSSSFMYEKYFTAGAAIVLKSI